MPANSWISTLERRIAEAAKPRSLEELNPGPAAQPAPVAAEDIAKMVATEVATQMEGLFGRLEALVKPAETVPAAPTSPAAAVTAPVVHSEPPAASATAETPAQPA